MTSPLSLGYQGKSPGRHHHNLVMWYGCKKLTMYCCFRFIRSRVTPLVTNEAQFLYICFLVGPFLQRFFTERTRCLQEVPNSEFYSYFMGDINTLLKGPSLVTVTNHWCLPSVYLNTCGKLSSLPPWWCQDHAWFLLFLTLSWQTFDSKQQLLYCWPNSALS